VTQRLVDQANATARLTGVDRTLIKESQALLLTFDSVNKTAGDAGGVFDRATQAAVDLAAAGFGSVTGNATQLGKALEDPIKGLSALTRSGVTFTAEQQALIRSLVESNRTLEAQGIILTAIETQVGGVAEATANGSDKMRQSFGILKEEIATALAPAFERLVEVGLEWIDKVGDWWTENGPSITARMSDFGKAVKETWGEFRTFVGLVRTELAERGVFARLSERFDRLKTQAGETGSAFDSMYDALAGDNAKEKASTFATLIEWQYIKPIEALIEKVIGLLGLLERLFGWIERIRDGFASEGFQGALRAAGLQGAGVSLSTQSPSSFGGGLSGRTVVQNIEINTPVDPEGAFRALERTLNAGNLRAGRVLTNAPRGR
jgi:hypothetical protein